jgi:2-iminobutanoate/2-iminopropanoate deaminase
MPRQIVRTIDAPASPVHSQAVRGGGLVFMSGQEAFDPVSGQVAGTSIQEHKRQGAGLPVRLSGMRMSVAVSARA